MAVLSESLRGFLHVIDLYNNLERTPVRLIGRLTRGRNLYTRPEVVYSGSDCLNFDDSPPGPLWCKRPLLLF
jgi:hypothetical protein